MRFVAKLHVPPLPDGNGGFFYVLPPKLLKYIRAKAVSAVRRDLMTSIVAVGRALAVSWPRAVVGLGQGGLVALLVAYPRLLERALAIVYAREPEGCASPRRGGVCEYSLRSLRDYMLPALLKCSSVRVRN